jgi:predicted cobalt transporter CbtA
MTAATCSASPAIKAARHRRPRFSILIQRDSGRKAATHFSLELPGCSTQFRTENRFALFLELLGGIGDMVGKLLLRGMLVGLIAGVLAFAFARVYGEPQVDKAIAFEEQQAQASGEAPEPEMVSRATQAGIGLATGVLVYGAALGGLFSLVFAYAYGRLGSLGPRGTSALIALLGFVAVIVVPSLKYPANPPAVGNAETIAYRTELFFIMIVVSIAAMVAAVGLAQRLWKQLGAWNASIVAGLAFLVVFALVKAALPDINEVPENFSATVLWQFRVASLGMQLVLWAVVGLGFGAVVERLVAASDQRGPARRYA